MHSSVKELEGNLEDISLNQQYANEGIYLLCRHGIQVSTPVMPAMTY